MRILRSSVTKRMRCGRKVASFLVLLLMVTSASRPAQPSASRTFISSTTRRSVERVEQSDPAALEMRDISRDEWDASDEGRGGDQHIGLGHGPTLLFSSCPESPRGERHLGVDRHDLWRRLGAQTLQPFVQSGSARALQTLDPEGQLFKCDCRDRETGWAASQRSTPEFGRGLTVSDRTLVSTSMAHFPKGDFLGSRRGIASFAPP